MARLFKLLLLCILLLALASPLAIYFLALDDKPIALPDPVPQQELMRLQRLITQQISQADADGRVVLRLGEQDVNTAIDFGLLTADVPIVEGAVASIDDDRLILRGSLDLPVNIGRHFVNFQVTLVPDGRTPHITRVQLGALPLPGFLLKSLEQRAYEMLETDQRLAMARHGWESIEDIAIDKRRLDIHYRITPATIQGLAKQQQKLLLEQLDTGSVEVYLAHLQPISEKPSAARYPLMGMLVPAFELAQQRTAGGRNPIMENSAALLALAMYTADPVVIEFMGLGERFGYPARRVTLTLHRRPDLAAHFLTSALITLFAGDQVAALMGLQKELDDSQSSSGFDMADLMADKAGIRFADLATANSASAQRIQDRLVQLLYDDELMPPPDKLPRIDEYELGNLNDSELEAYLNRTERQINELLNGIRLYQN